MVILRGLLVALALCVAAAPAHTAEPGEPGYGVRFHEQAIDELKQAAEDLDTDDVMAVFRHVFAAAPEEVTVYPTENYYYFTFVAGGLEYAGNMRLDVSDRDEGVLHFAYYVKDTMWGEIPETNYRALTDSDGVEVTKEGDLAYRVSFGDKSSLFLLNDLSDAAPPKDAVREGESYLGPVFDESGIAFHLIFSDARSEFLFVLDEEGAPNDTFVPVHADHPDLTIGRRTGFAFYRDRFAPRRILVGVNGHEVELNTWLDGPFDQLPDNFIEGEALREAILAKHPDLEGEIGRLGGFRSQEGRVLVTPYINYGNVGELQSFLRCADPALEEDRFYACLAPPAM